tara:strand:+ start:390 stop:1028 length:639 start_codon:yes stop_codon:yes gene_type:complete
MKGIQSYKIPNRKLPRIHSMQEPALAQAFNELAQAIEESPAHKNIIAGTGVKIIEDADSVIFEALPPPTPPTKYFPFKIYQKDSEAEPLGVSIFYGTINNFVPKIGSTEISQPETTGNGGTGAGNEPVLTVSSSDGDHVIQLKYTPIDNCGNGTEAAEIETESTLTTDTATNGYIEIGKVKVEDGAITQIFQTVTHSLQHKSCGTTHYFWGI